MGHSRERRMVPLATQLMRSWTPAVFPENTFRRHTVRFSKMRLHRGHGGLNARKHHSQLRVAKQNTPTECQPMASRTFSREKQGKESTVSWTRVHLQRHRAVPTGPAWWGPLATPRPCRSDSHPRRGTAVQTCLGPRRKRTSPTCEQDMSFHGRRD